MNLEIRTHSHLAGSGKSSLIKSIVQACDDIVHVDPVEKHALPDNSRPRSTINSKNPVALTLSEIYASTKPYPPWWSDLEDSRVLRRRKNNGEIVLERNLCFVDTLTASKSRLHETEAIIQYMKQQLSRAVASIRQPSLDLQNMLGGNGGSQVDVLLYLISEGPHFVLSRSCLMLLLTRSTMCRHAFVRCRMHPQTLRLYQRYPLNIKSRLVLRPPNRRTEEIVSFPHQRSRHSTFFL